MISGFPIALLPLVRSPHDGSSLTLFGTSDDPYVMEGMAKDNSGNHYRITGGILRLLSAEHLLPLEQAELEKRDEESGRYDARLAARYFREVVPFMRILGIRKDDVVLELAAGTGRITREIAKAGCRLIATDFSFDSLRVAAETLPAECAVGLVEADSVVFPGAREFSLVCSAQFIEHIPTQMRRTEHFAHLATLVRDSGRVVISAYHHDLRRRVEHLPTEGTHPNGIFFHYFTGSELAALGKAAFTRVAIEYLDAVPPGVARLCRSERLLGFLSHVFVRSPLAPYAHLVVLRATHPRTT